MENGKAVNWTGHSDYKAMKPYIDIAEKTKADAMKLIEDAWGEMTLLLSLLASSWPSFHSECLIHRNQKLFYS